MATNKWMTKLCKDMGSMASDLKKFEAPIVPAWSPSLCWALTTKGWKPGKINTLFGAESCGKSMLAMMAIVQLQKQDPEAIAVWFDSEFSFSSDFFIQLGGDADRLYVRKSNDPVKIFDYISSELLEMIQDGAPIKAIVIDSIRSIRYPKDVKKVSTDMIMGGSGANYLPSAFKGILPIIAEHNILTFLIQQVSIQIDQYKAMRNPYVLPDGQALKHISDTMVEITKLETKDGSVEVGETIAGGKAQIGHKVRVKIRKNRLGIPARVAQFTFHYGNGITDIGGEIFELAKSLDIVKHPINPETGKVNNQMWNFSNYPAVRGEANMRKLIVDDFDLQQSVLEACYAYKDGPVEADASGFVNDENDTEI